jgi:predicted nuclease with TOPRIM domain
LIENENIALKKELAALKEKPDPSVPVVVVTEAPRGADGKVIRQICSNMKNVLMRTQSDIVKLKMSYAQEVAGLAAQRNQMSKAFQKYITLYDIKQAEFEALEYSRDQLQERLDETKDELEMNKNGQAQDIARLKLKYKNARTDLSDSQAEAATLKEKIKAMDEKYNELSAVKAESDAHYNVSLSRPTGTLCFFSLPHLMTVLPSNLLTACRC